MKKVLALFAVAASLTLVSCNENHEEAEGTVLDSTSVEQAPEMNNSATEMTQDSANMMHTDSAMHMNHADSAMKH